MVSFPPLIDMLKFSGYPYLIRGQPVKIGVAGQCRPGLCSEKDLLRSEPGRTATDFKARQTAVPKTQRAGLVIMTLEQACPAEYHGAQYAFKDSMIH